MRQAAKDQIRSDTGNRYTQLKKCYVVGTIGEANPAAAITRVYKDMRSAVHVPFKCKATLRVPNPLRTVPGCKDESTANERTSAVRPQTISNFADRVETGCGRAIDNANYLAIDDSGVRTD